MVNLVEQWEEMEQYASRASYATARAFQKETVYEKTRVRVLVGKFGFEKEFSDPKDQLLARIQSFCNSGKFLNVGKTIPDDQFFK